MAQKLVFIHTVAPLVAVFARLGAELLPEVGLSHILDEPLREQFARRGRLAPEDAARLLTHVRSAEAVGATAVLVTCSTLSLAVDDIRGATRLPLFKIDEAMVAQAVELGPRVGVVATARSTLEATRALFDAQSRQSGRPIELQMSLVEDALPLLLAGNGAEHDRLVKQALMDLAARVDVLVLAQASMARVLDTLPETERPVPLLASPYTALRQVRAALPAAG